jgi:O-antigen ligase
VVFSAAYVIETALLPYQEAKISTARSISARQIVENMESVVTDSGEQTEGTKMWRIQWWDTILKDTLYGEHFWTGRGFGLNLAEADRISENHSADHSPLRSPHSVNMTILARAGVPGLALWAAFLISWFAMLMKATHAARHRQDWDWAGLFLFIACYNIGIFINASFDVAIEGPMLGIWFWCLIGFGIGCAMLYRPQVKNFSRRMLPCPSDRWRRPISA